jgi:type IV pilus assembly protein PilA
MNKAQKGFTLIELMIVVAIIGILASMAIPAFQRYSIRAQIAEGIALTGPVTVAMAEYFNDRGEFPADNTVAGLSPASAYAGTYVQSISVSLDTISIQYGNQANSEINGETVTIVAAGSSGSVRWTCASGGVIPDKYLPSSCR